MKLETCHLGVSSIQEAAMEVEKVDGFPNSTRKHDTLQPGCG